MYLFQSSPYPAVVRALDVAIRQDLQSSRDSWFFWLVFSAGVVVIGVVLEGPELVYETLNIVRRKCLRKRLLCTPDWVKLVALLGWCLVVLGVAGEGIAEKFTSWADGNLQTFNDILLADARKEAGDAKTSAEGAANAAGRANEQAEKAESKANKVGALADSANRREQETEKQLVDEEAKRAELEKGISPRTLSYTNFNGIENIVHLKKFAGAPISIRFIPDFEAHRAADGIATITARAGWSVLPLTVGEQRVGSEGTTTTTTDFFRYGPGVSEIGTTTAGDEGVFVQYNFMDLSSECAARALVDFLRSNDWVAQTDFLTPRVIKRDNIPPRTVNVFVGFKPTLVKPPEAKQLEQAKNDTMSQQTKIFMAQVETRHKQECEQTFGP